MKPSRLGTKLLRSGPHPHDMSALLFQMIIGYRVSQVLYVAAKLGIADLVQEGKKHGRWLVWEEFGL